MHHTPTYSSWLNQVDLWFSKIERDVIDRGVFKSVPDLKRKHMRYIRHYNKNPKVFKWSYKSSSHRITPTTVSNVSEHKNGRNAKQKHITHRGQISIIDILGFALR